MIICIIAGGSGTRLWPLSTPEYPKHLLKINEDSESLLQSTYERCRLITNKIYVITESSHSELVFNQLSKFKRSNLIIEPLRRGTANCILNALIKIGNIENKDEPIAFVHADHYIRDIAEFTRTFIETEKIAIRTNSLLLVGVEPNYAATGFGYIKKGDLLSNVDGLYKVEQFIEKPDYESAIKYLSTGKFLWNCGYFIGSKEVFVGKMKKYAPSLYRDYCKLENSEPDKFDKAYTKLKTGAIDYELIEKIPNLLVYPATFDWMDMGSFEDMSKQAINDEYGNYFKGSIYKHNISNSYIINKINKPLVVMGLDNVIVVNTDKGLLITRKDLSQKVGDISKEINKENE